jgi:hypothetical protein
MTKPRLIPDAALARSRSLATEDGRLDHCRKARHDEPRRQDTRTQRHGDPNSDGRSTINADELVLLSDHSRVVGRRAECHYRWEPIIGAAVVDQS